MNIFDILYTGLSPYFFAKFLSKYKDLKTAINYLNARFNPPINIVEKRKKKIILHGASIGETKALLFLRDALDNTNKNLEVIITTATHTAYNLLHNNSNLNNKVLYMPFDFYSKIKKFIQSLAPSILVIAEQEIWPNLILNASKAGTHIFFVNFRIKPYKAFIYSIPPYKDILKTKISRFFCLNDFTVNELVNLGVPQEKIEKTENLKCIPYLMKTPLQNERKLNLVCILSIHKKEEHYILKICKYLRNIDSLKFVVIPRHTHHSGYFYKFFSRKFKSIICDGLNYITEEADLPPYDIFIINRYGIVEEILKKTKYTIMGGTFINIGGHNILEPIFYSNKVMVGKHYQNITEEVNKGINMGIVYKESDLYKFPGYEPTTMLKLSTNFFSNIENPLEKITLAILSTL